MERVRSERKARRGNVILMRWTFVVDVIVVIVCFYSSFLFVTEFCLLLLLC